MKFIVRWTLRLLVLAVVLVVALVLLKDTILKEVAEGRIRAATGLEARIGRFELGLLAPTVTLENFRLYNPPDFGGTPFVDLPELHFEYDRDALARGKLHLRLVRLNLAEITLVENLAGRSNLEAIQALLQQRKPPPSAQVEFAGIDTFNLTVGRIKRFSLKDPSRVGVTNVDVQHEIFTGLRTEGDFFIAMGRLVIKLGLRELTNAVPRLSQAVRDAKKSPVPAPPQPSAVLPSPARPPRR